MARLMRRQQLDGIYAGSAGEIFQALCRTLSFRRWAIGGGVFPGPIPDPGHRYGCEFGSVRRVGRVVEVIRPVVLTLKEIVLDPPCRVSLTMRWRIDPGLSGCTVRLRVHYQLNQAAMLRARHWERRLLRNFRNQFSFLAVNLESIQPGKA
jgi:hypothetical protein